MAQVAITFSGNSAAILSMANYICSKYPGISVVECTRLLIQQPELHHGLEDTFVVKLNENINMLA